MFWGLVGTIGGTGVMKSWDDYELGRVVGMVMSLVEMVGVLVGYWSVGNRGSIYTCGGGTGVETLLYVWLEGWMTQ